MRPRLDFDTLVCQNYEMCSNHFGRNGFEDPNIPLTIDALLQPPCFTDSFTISCNSGNKALTPKLNWLSDFGSDASALVVGRFRHFSRCSCGFGALNIQIVLLTRFPFHCTSDPNDCIYSIAVMIFKECVKVQEQNAFTTLESTLGGPRYPA